MISEDQLKKNIITMIQSAPEGDLERVSGAIINMFKPTGDTSDGYHTFNELYEHRIMLFITLIACIELPCWRSFVHDDGTRMEGWFIAGIDLPTGTITYHLPDKYWDMLSGYAEALDKAPKWDGHTPADVIDRLTKYVEMEEK